MAATKQIRYSRVVHLSHAIGPDIPIWPGDPAVVFETVATRGREGYVLRRFSLGEHGGTHVNAPLSFHELGAPIDACEADRLVLPAVVIDVRARARADADFLLSPEDVREFEARHGPIPPESLVVLRSGWQERWTDPASFLNADRSGVFHFPGFGAAAARVLLDERRVGGIGVDTHGVDGGCEASFPVNAMALERGRIVLENLTNLEEVPPRGATVIVGILRLRGGTGSPAAVLALVP